MDAKIVGETLMNNGKLQNSKVLLTRYMLKTKETIVT